ncbi:MAG: hypothetical protein FWC85_00380, partial [Elusimicrobia bacterium]|nr:hypothetical protein [Elusimicrobiota bacterium]
MSSKIINIALNENLIDFTANHILSFKGGFSDTLVITNTKRGGVFLRRAMAGKLGKAFAPPDFLTFDNLIQKLAFDNTEFRELSDLNAAFALFEIINNEKIHISQNQNSFALFYDWAFEILKFIELLDIENISATKLQNVKAAASIGYNVPENINRLLENIALIRNAFHKHMESSLQITKGYAHIKASRADMSDLFENYKNIVLVAPVYLSATQMAVLKKLYDSGKLTIIVQGNPKEWRFLDNIYKSLG